MPSQPRDPGRCTPAKGVHLLSGQRNWVFLTVCTEKRNPWLAQDDVQKALHHVWKEIATNWLVSDYLLMPDHLHLFCAPLDPNCSMEAWIKYWKQQFAKQEGKWGKFQQGGFHHRLRNDDSYETKWQYVRENPVRGDLVKQAGEWPYQGKVHEIHW